jgi:hypothetical protein
MMRIVLRIAGILEIQALNEELIQCRHLYSSDLIARCKCVGFVSSPR